MKPAILSLVSLLAPLTAAATLPVISASRCSGCSEMQFEQKALAAGTGKHYLYDFATDMLVGFQVTREPAGGGSSTYELDPLILDPAYTSYFERERAYRVQYGSFEKDVVIDARNPGSAPGSGQSVFDIMRYTNTVVTYGHQLGTWMASNDPLAALIHDQIIKNNDDPKKVTVTLLFKDGRAKFVVNDTVPDATYVEGSAEDSQGNLIPTSTGAAQDNGPYGFPNGGDPSGPERDFHGYLDGRWPNGHWACGTASIPANGSVRTCTWVKPN